MVAAGLTPGIVTGTPTPQAPNPDVEFTAADVISINGDVFDFDDLFAMRQINRDQLNTPKMYGPPASIREKEEKARQEAMRQDSIRRVEEARALVYGPPPPKYKFIDPEQLRDIASESKDEAIGIVLSLLMDYCSQMPLPDTDVTLSENINFIRDLKMDSQQLEELLEEIEYRSGVQLTEDMFKQLGTPLRIANFVVEVITPITKE